LQGRRQRNSRRVGQAGRRRTGRRGVEWQRYIDRCGRKSAPTCSLAHIKRKCSEAKWADASKWVKAQLARTSNRKYRPSDKQKPNVTVAQANKKHAARFYQLKTKHRLTGQHLQWTMRRPDAKCWWYNCCTRPKHESICSRTARSGKASRRLCGRWSDKKPAGAKTGSRSRSSSPTRDAARRS